jgi:hypothetical protein
LVERHLGLSHCSPFKIFTPSTCVLLIIPSIQLTILHFLLTAQSKMKVTSREVLKCLALETVLFQSCSEIFFGLSFPFRHHRILLHLSVRLQLFKSKLFSLIVIASLFCEREEAMSIRLQHSLCNLNNDFVAIHRFS